MRSSRAQALPNTESNLIEPKDKCWATKKLKIVLVTIPLKKDL